MSNLDNMNPDLDMPDEIDFTAGKPNRYAQRNAEGTNVILLDPDLRDVFPDSESVNNAHRPLADLIRARSIRPLSFQTSGAFTE